ncbi:L,D-transpeptidase family protein [Neorhizobium sp. NPDC001467]|uniref:L,D-transpeptidase family protein n=1 Tax=Neorhizobium sp. NPDC001467 TaxID=3390595 RepID=UPI003D06221E
MRANGQKKRACRTIVVRSSPADRTRALVRFGAVTLPAAIGRAGATALKREGDGATPIAAMSVLHGFFRGDRVRSLLTALPMRRIRPDMLWCDDPHHPSYNRLVKAPFRRRHEEMRREDCLYDVCLVLDWNISARKRNRGSAIFLHLTRPGYQPTAGCVAVTLTDMQRLLRFIRRRTIVKVVG